MHKLIRFEKLIRDRIPELISLSGREPHTRQLDDVSIQRFLANKLLEEAYDAFDAFRNDKREALTEELADLLEVIDRVATLTGISRDEIENVRREKSSVCGVFTNNLLLCLDAPEPKRLLAAPAYPLAQVLKYHLARCRRAHLAVAFVMTSGVNLLANSFAAALARGAEIRLLTTDYLGVTEPEALEQLIRLPGKLDVRLYSEPGRSYHPKAYLFEYSDDGRGIAFIGSSNLSRSALEGGVEWNYEIRETDRGWPLGEFIEHFERLFDSSYSRTVTSALIESYRAVRHPRTLVDDEACLPAQVSPRPAQTEALVQLAALRADGESRGLVIAATGIGKTYLAAFDSRPYPRVLFIAHREELLLQAEVAFSTVRPYHRRGFYVGDRREAEVDLLFATVQTLGRQEHLTQFSPDRFDYLVVDEFHHAAAKTYQAILNHFRPQFLLGLTATPYRADNRDIFALCDGNIAYRLNFIEAIGFGWLCPFHYYGLYDDTNYEAVPWRNNGYDEAALENALSTQKRAEAVIRVYRKHPGRAALGFCASVRHADFMSRYFNEQGIPALSVHSGPGSPPRNSAIEKLTQGAVEIVFTVDLFNEGVDIPIIDRVLFLRPTESITVFLQQLGRGLRIHAEKEYLTVLDFIGNYLKAHYKVSILSGSNEEDIDAATHKAIRRLIKGTLTDNLPPGIEIHFDLQAIDLIERLSRQQDPIRQRLITAYREIEQDLGRQPNLLDVHRHGRYDVRRYCQAFDSWYGFLTAIDELTAIDKTLSQEVGIVLKKLEKAPLTNSYKMVVLESFVQHSGLDNPVSIENIANDFRVFFANPRHHRDIVGTAIENIEALDDSTLQTYLESNSLSAWNDIPFFHYDVLRQVLAYKGPQPSDSWAFATAILVRVQFRLADYFERRFERHNVFPVIHAGQGRGIIMLGDNPQVRFPRGKGWKVALVDGQRFYVKFAKIAINVLKERPIDDHSIPN